MKYLYCTVCKKYTMHVHEGNSSTTIRCLECAQISIISWPF